MNAVVKVETQALVYPVELCRHHGKIERAISPCRRHAKLVGAISFVCQVRVCRCCRRVHAPVRFMGRWRRRRCYRYGFCCMGDIAWRCRRHLLGRVSSIVGRRAEVVEQIAFFVGGHGYRRRQHVPSAGQRILNAPESTVCPQARRLCPLAILWLLWYRCRGRTGHVCQQRSAEVPEEKPDIPSDISKVNIIAIFPGKLTNRAELEAVSICLSPSGTAIQ